MVPLSWTSRYSSMSKSALGRVCRGPSAAAEGPAGGRGARCLWLRSPAAAATARGEAGPDAPAAPTKRSKGSCSPPLLVWAAAKGGTRAKGVGA
jgi:hypothetical protein